MKVLDLDENNFSSDSVEENLEFLKLNYSKKFIIKKGKIELKAKISKTTNKKYYVISNIIDENNPNFTFKITFIDYFSSDYESGCYINNFHNSKTYTGTQIISTILLFLQKLKIKRATLEDAAYIKCENGDGNIHLSLYKLLEKGVTFYKKFGFDLKLDTTQLSNRVEFYSTSQIEKILKKNLKKIASTTIGEIFTSLNKTLEIFTKAMSELSLRDIIPLNSDGPIYKYEPYFYIEEITLFLNFLKSETKFKKSENSTTNSLSEIEKMTLSDFLLKSDCSTFSKMVYFYGWSIPQSFQYKNKIIRTDNYISEIVLILRHCVFVKTF